MASTLAALTAALGAQRDLGAVEDRVTLVKDGDSVAPGVGVIDTPGHTPGHMSLLVEGGEGLILGADVNANEVVSLRHPDWAFGFDSDRDQAIATRKALLERAASDRMRYLGFHFTYPGVGFVERDGGAFRFVPA